MVTSFESSLRDWKRRSLSAILKVVELRWNFISLSSFQVLGSEYKGIFLKWSVLGKGSIISLAFLRLRSGLCEAWEYQVVWKEEGPYL